VCECVICVQVCHMCRACESVSYVCKCVIECAICVRVCHMCASHVCRVCESVSYVCKNVISSTMHKLTQLTSLHPLSGLW